MVNVQAPAAGVTTRGLFGALHMNVSITLTRRMSHKSVLIRENQ